MDSINDVFITSPMGEDLNKSVDNILKNINALVDILRDNNISVPASFDEFGRQEPFDIFSIIFSSLRGQYDGQLESLLNISDIENSSDGYDLSGIFLILELVSLIPIVGNIIMFFTLLYLEDAINEILDGIQNVKDAITFLKKHFQEQVKQQEQ